MARMKIRKRKSKNLHILHIILIFFIVYIVILILFQLIKISKNSETIENLNREVISQQNQVNELEQNKEWVNSKEYVERTAKEKGLMTFPNEAVILDDDVNTNSK